MFCTLCNEGIVSSFSQVGIMKILIIERRDTPPFPYMFTRTWQGMFRVTQNLSGYSRKCVRINTARCLFSCSKRFEQPEKSCRPCGQSHLQSREIKFCLSVGFLAEQTRNLVAGIEIQYSGRYIPKNAGGVLSQKISLRRSSEIRHLNNLRYI